VASLEFRTCPDCGGERLFERFHGAPGECPDTPGGQCPEWSCTSCGAAFFAGFVPAPARRVPAQPAGKVA
jgi:hypothetical protein